MEMPRRRLRGIDDALTYRWSPLSRGGFLFFLLQKILLCLRLETQGDTALTPHLTAAKSAAPLRRYARNKVGPRKGYASFELQKV
jgi:hypothetical protein